MAKDDYYVIVYRLLKYLYDCLKKSVAPKNEVLTPDFWGIGEDYFTYIVKHLLSDGYVEGAAVVSILGKADGDVKIGSHFKITPKGIAYLEENSMFQKIRNAVKDILPI